MQTRSRNARTSWCGSCAPTASRSTGCIRTPRGQILRRDDQAAGKPGRDAARSVQPEGGTIAGPPVRHRSGHGGPRSEMKFLDAPLSKSAARGLFPDPGARFVRSSGGRRARRTRGATRVVARTIEAELRPRIAEPRRFTPGSQSSGATIMSAGKSNASSAARRLPKPRGGRWTRSTNDISPRTCFRSGRRRPTSRMTRSSS